MNTKSTGETLTLTAADGHVFSAYVAEPEGTPRGGVIVVQDIFGVNAHFRAVADRYAALGYRAIAPALFDRVRPNVELPYTTAGRDEGRAVVADVTFEAAGLDLDATRAALAAAGKVGIVGFCWGGTVGWTSVTRFDGFAAASCYYPGRIQEFAAETPRCPVQFHFAEHDHSIGPAEIDVVRAAQHANVEIFVYPASHGFNCDVRAEYDAPSATLARDRTLRLLREHVG